MCLQYRRPEFNPLSQENLLENGVVTRSNILAGEIPWTEEPEGLESIGLQESDMI